jgi:hypothetical protein
MHFSRIEYFNGTKIPPNSPQFISGNIIDLGSCSTYLSYLGLSFSLGSAVKSSPLQLMHRPFLVFSPDFAVQGYIPKAQYDKWLGQQWFGVNVPASFDGYNAPNEFFPYWSAPSFTKSVALLALAKHDKLAQHC